MSALAHSRKNRTESSETRSSFKENVYIILLISFYLLLTIGILKKLIHSYLSLGSSIFGPEGKKFSNKIK